MGVVFSIYSCYVVDALVDERNWEKVINSKHSLDETNIEFVFVSRAVSFIGELLRITH